jgi:hypothetical protein
MGHNMHFMHSSPPALSRPDAPDPVIVDVSIGTPNQPGVVEIAIRLTA